MHFVVVVMCVLFLIPNKKYINMILIIIFQIFCHLIVMAVETHTGEYSMCIIIIIIIMYIYHVLINALSAHMIHINLNMIFYTHVNG